MNIKPFTVRVGTALVAVASLAIAAYVSVPTRVLAQGGAAASIGIDADDIAGVVTSSKGPEAGVWVIAETTDLPTKFFKMVVTDDRGRFLVPDLPRARYQVFVRGYGLVDSIPVAGTPGQRLSLSATIAPTPRDAAQYYPASYWLALLRLPEDLPGSGAQGNGFSAAVRSQEDVVGVVKGCMTCHQLGSKATREIPKEYGLTGAAAWDYRVQVGQRGATMSVRLNEFGRAGMLRVFGDWTDRIAAGEIPKDVPARPTGIERNLVVSRWDWRGEQGNIHDSVSTDKRNPGSVNLFGKIYGVDLMNDVLGWVDPVENQAGGVKIPVRDPDTPSFAAQSMPFASLTWGEEIIWKSPANMHNPMMDGQGRVWLTSSLRPANRQPNFCKDPNNKFAKYYPLERSSRQASYYDPKTDQTTLIDTCFGTHHLQFGDDADNTLYYSGGGDAIGWIKTNLWDQTKNAERSQGWCPVVVDTTGDGKIGAFTALDEARDPSKDMQMTGGAYGIIVSKVDGSVWWADPGVPGKIARLEIGNNPPATCRAEVYAPPFDAHSPNLATSGYLPRGIDVDRDTGVVWTALAGTGALASFDRRKCKVLNGPTATGDHCREGWTLIQTPSPRFQNAKMPSTADHHYYNWVDQQDTLGLGKNVPVVMGTNSDALYALVDGKWITMRVPYPLGGFFTKGVDGRVDDPRAGWKGKGWYASSNLVPVWHQEGGKGVAGGVYKLQLRPDPLAR